MIKIIRNKINTYCVFDYIYKDDKLIGEQSNLTSKNRFGAKKFKCNNGKTLNVDSWGWGDVKE